MHKRVPRHALRRFLLAAVIVAAALAAVVAQAPASGATTAPRLTATQDGTATGLVPGGPAAPINYTITNPTATPVYAHSVTVALTQISYVAAAGSGVGSSWRNHPAGGAAPGCSAADFTISQPDPLRRELSPGDTFSSRTTAGGGSAIAMVNSNRNQDDCRGTTVTLAVSVA